MEYLLYLLGLGAAAYLLRPQKKAETAQELLDFRDISPDGIIELPDFKFRLVIEAEPANLSLRSLQEQAAAWLNLRSMLNSINIPHTYLVQTRYLNIKDYLQEYKRQSERMPEHIAAYAAELTDWLASEAADKNLRDRRHFIILKFDAAENSVAGGVRVENELVDRVLSGAGKIAGNRLPPDEMHRLARNELTEAVAVICGTLNGMEIPSYVLDRRGVLDMLYQTLNRDLAPFARLKDADAYNSFSLFPHSKTPDIVITGLEGRSP